MGKKKKGVKKGKKAKSSGSDAVEEYEIPFEINPPRKVVIIKPQLLHWNFSKKLWPEAGFELDIRTKLRTIKGMITKRHRLGSEPMLVESVLQEMVSTSA